MVATYRFMLFSGLVIALMSLPVISACTGGQKSIQQQVQPTSSDDDIILRNFDHTHAAISAMARQKVVPEDVAEKANELKIELKKYLIKTHADLQILEVDVLHASDAERKNALNKLMNLSAERERVKVQYLQRLQSLLPQKAESVAATPLPAVSPSVESREKGTGEKGPDTKWRTKDLDIEIEIAPEDISTGEHD